MVAALNAAKPGNRLASSARVRRGAAANDGSKARQDSCAACSYGWPSGAGRGGAIGRDGGAVTRRSTGRPVSPGSSTPGSRLAAGASRRVVPCVPDERTRRVFQLRRRPLARRVPRRRGIALSDVAVATANALGADGMSGQPAAGTLRRPISPHQRRLSVPVAVAGVQGRDRVRYSCAHVSCSKRRGHHLQLTGTPAIF